MVQQTDCDDADAAAMSACVGQYAVLHTQEVTGSSPAVSTKKFLISQEIRNFFLFMFSNSDAVLWRFSHDPNRDPKAERSGKHQRGADGIIRPSLRLFFVGYMVWLMTLPMVSAASRFIPSVAWV